jgi:serine/threonine protein kinase
MRMPEMLRCPNGHEWEARPGESASGEPWPCPECGSTERTLVSPPTLPLDVPLPPALETLRSPDPRQVPELAGYEILEELGQGGMGVVYRARERDTDRVVALKVIRRERLQHPDMVNRFHREALAAARLSHPNVVAVFGADQEGEVHYLAMEYVAGLTLQRLVEESGPLSVAHACEVIRQSALGLQHAADQALVHRDIKPSNLMVVARPGEPLPPRPIVKILDMGVARLYQLRDVPEESLTTLTRDGVVIGTPDYIAPEQLEDPHRADIRADLYSLGCTFYFLLTGKVPFPGGTLVQKLDRQRWQTPVSVDQLRPEVPRGVAAVVRRLLAKHPDDRYASPGELAGALGELGRTGILPASMQPEVLREKVSFRAHEGPVVAVVFSPGGKRVWSAGADRMVRCRDVAGGAEEVAFGPAGQEVGALALAPVTGRVLIARGVSVSVREMPGGKEVLRLRGHHDAVRSLGVSADGLKALTGSEGRTARLWDLQTGREVQCLSGGRGNLTNVALSGNGRLALTAGRDGFIQVWDAVTAQVVNTLRGPRGQVMGLAISPDGQRAVSGHFDTTVRVWDLPTGRELRRLSGHRQMVSAVAAAPNGRVLSASHDRTVRVWDVDSGCEVYCCEGHVAAVLALAVSADGRRVAAGGVDGMVRLWEVPG